MDKQKLDDKQLLTDALQSQRHLTETYNSFAAESTDSELRRQVMDIHRQEHDNAYKVFQAMTKKGWYNVGQADQRQVSEFQSQLRSNQP